MMAFALIGALVVMVLIVLGAFRLVKGFNSNEDFESHNYTHKKGNDNNE